MSKAMSNQGQQKLLIQKSISDRDFMKIYRDDFGDTKEKSTRFLIEALKCLYHSIESGKFDDFKTMFDRFVLIASIEVKENLKESIESPENPFKSTNVLILACKCEKFEILRYIFSNTEDLKYFGDEIKLNDKDEFGHTAIYYILLAAGRDDCLLETLLKKFPISTQSELNETLSTPYNELRTLSNVQLSEQMVLFVENYLVNLNFHSKATEVSSDIEKIRSRVKFLTELVDLLNEKLEKSTEGITQELLFLMKSVVLNISILKNYLKFTYDSLPWEEIEFVLINFLFSQTKNQDLNFFILNCLNREKVVKFLKDFVRHLNIQMVTRYFNVQKIAALPEGLKRHEAAGKILKAAPEFESLYAVYKEIREVQSLENIIRCVQPTSSLSFFEKEDQFSLIRALQMVAENLKSTLESPNLSEVVSEILLFSLPSNTRKIVKSLKNAPSFANFLSKCLQLEKHNEDPTFYQTIRNDLMKITLTAQSILLDHTSATLKKILDDIVKVSTVEGFQKIVEILQYLNISKLEPFIDQITRIKPMDSLIGGLNTHLQKKDSCQRKTLLTIQEFIWVKLNNVDECTENYKETLKLLSEIQKLNFKSFNINSLTKIQATIKNSIFPKFSLDLEEKDLKEIADKVNGVVDKAQLRVSNQCDYDEINKLNFLISNKAKLEINQISRLESNEVLLANPEAPKIYSKADYYEFYNKKIEDLKEVLNNFEVNDKIVDNYTCYKGSRKFQMAVEILLSQILGIVWETGDKNDGNYALFLDAANPLLIGASLKHHLAHDNAIIGFMRNYRLNTFLSAYKFVNESSKLFDSGKTIFKNFPDDIDKVKLKFSEGLTVIQNQDVLFNELEKGNLENVKNQLLKGVNIYGRDISSASVLHFASKSKNVSLLNFLFENYKIDEKSQNNLGQNALHIAASHSNSESLIQYLIKTFRIDVNSTDKSNQTPLHKACEKGFIGNMTVLLKYKAKTSISDNFGYEPIHIATKNNQLETVKFLFEKETNQTPDGGLTGIQIAAEYDFLEILEYLLEKKRINVNTKNNEGESALTLAAKGGHFECVERLLISGADVNATLNNGLSALHFSVQNNHLEMTKLLIEYKALVNHTEDYHKNSPIFYASMNGNAQILELLLNNGAVVNAMRKDNKTPLIFAIQKGHTECVKILLDYGANTIFHKLNTSALHYVHESAKKEIVQLLIDRKVEMNFNDLKHFTPLHLCCMKEDCYEIVELLLNNGANVNLRDLLKGTVMSKAIRYGSKKLVNLLLSKNASIKTKCFSKMNSFHDAALNKTKNVKDIMAICLNNGVDINSKTKDGFTPLHCAIYERNMLAFEFLLDNGADFSIPDDNRNTPLEFCVIFNNYEMAKMLFDRGASLADSPNRGNSFDLLANAVSQKNPAMVQLLLQKSRNWDFKFSFTLSLVMKNFEIFEILSRYCKSFTTMKSVDETPFLHTACSFNLTEFVKFMIKKGCKIDEKSNTMGFTPLHHAAETGKYDCTKILIEKGANLNIQNVGGRTALMGACLYGHTEVVRLLLNSNANDKIRDYEDQSALEWAIAHNHLDALKVFFELNKVVVNERGKHDGTALHVACQFKHFDVVKFLVEKGFAMNIVDKNHRRPFEYLIANPEGLKIYEYLLANKFCNPNEVCYMSYTILQLSILSKQLDVVRLLLKYKADINKPNFIGQFPIHAAAQSNSKEAVKILLENGASFNAIDFSKEYPIHKTENDEVRSLLKATENLFNAAKANKIENVKKHYANGGIIHAKNSEGFSALHYACWKGFEKIVEFLLEKGADLNTVDGKNNTPLHYASKFSHYNILIHLLTSGAQYDVKSENGKTPADFAENEKIKTILLSIEKSFEMIQKADHNVIDEILKIKDMKIVRAVMSTKNRHNRNLIFEAIHLKFPKVTELKSIFQRNCEGDILKTKKCAQLGQYKEALSICERLFEKRMDIFGRDNAATFDILQLKGNVHYRIGEYHKAQELYNEIIQKYTEVLGADHIDTLNVKGDLGMVFYRLGRNEEAIKLLRAAHRKQCEVLGRMHPETLQTYSSVAAVLEKLGRYNESLYIYKLLYQCFLVVYNEMDPVVISNQNNVAFVLGNMGRTEEAMAMYEDVLRKKKKVLGEHHVDTLRTRFNMLATQSKELTNREDLKEFEELFALQEKHLGAFHLDTVNTQSTIGQILLKNQKYLAAYKILQKNQSQRKVALGANHPINANIDRMISIIKLSSQFSKFQLDIDAIQNQFFAACGSGDVNVIESFLNIGGNVDETDKEGRNGLHFAIDACEEKVVKLLLKANIDATQATKKGNTPLHTATSKNCEKIVNELVQYVKNKNRKQLSDFINAKTSGNETTALHLAAKNNSRETMQILLKNGAVFNPKTKDKKTPMELVKDESVKKLLKLIEDCFMKAKQGDDKVIQILNDLSVPDFTILTNARDSSGNTVLQVAIMNKHSKIVGGISEMLKNKI